MSRLLQTDSGANCPQRGPRVFSIDDEGSDAVFSVLASEVARGVLERLHDSPATQSEIANRVDTSIQNVGYHLNKLVDAGLVVAVDQCYSEKGREMDVYAPADDPLILVAGERDEGETRVAVDGRQAKPTTATPNIGD